jgi:hypothetical protein
MQSIASCVRSSSAGQDSVSDREHCGWGCGLALEMADTRSVLQEQCRGVLRNVGFKKT